MLRESNTRELVKLCKVYNPEWDYKQIAEAIGITPNSFYNWMAGYYDLSRKKELELRSLLVDLMYY